MNINLIAAVGKNYELGKDNDLIWHIKGDMKFFKDITMGHPIVMGRKTFESLPKVLPGRKNIVISRNNNIINDEIELYKSIKDFLINYKNYKDSIFIIGGESMYREFLPYSSNIYLTEINKEDRNATTYFPRFDKKLFDSNILSTNIENDIEYKHVLYKRKQ